MNAKIIKKLTKRLEGSTFLPYVKVHSVDDYFNLPKSEREKWGLYRRPFALPCEWLNSKISVTKQDKKGWKAWDEEIKRQYPIQSFFREWLLSYDNPVYAFFKHIYWDYIEFHYSVKRFIKPFFPRFRKSMPRHEYHDVSEAFRRVNFALILDFWHEEMVDGVVDWNASPLNKKFYKEAKAAAKYIEVDRPTLEAKMDRELTAATNKRKGNYEQKYKKHNELEKKIAEKDTAILVWAMQNREMFWT